MTHFDESPERIRDLIRGGESQSLEFKTRLPHQDLTAQLLTGFANAEGGLLLIGVADKGDIVGIAETEGQHCVAQLKRLVTSLFSWPATVGAVILDGKLLVYASIPKAPKGYYPVATSRGEYFVRRGVMNGIATPEELGLGHSPQLNFEVQPLPERIAVVAMSFRDEEEPALVDYFRAMERAAKESQLPIKVRRMDLVEGDFEISQQIMDEIDASHIVIADFTLNSRNVYFELGYARAKRRRIIQTARKGTTLEFDVRNWRTVFYRNATELQEKMVSEFRSAYGEVTPGR